MGAPAPRRPGRGGGRRRRRPPFLREFRVRGANDRLVLAADREAGPVRPATLGDYEVLGTLFDELDELHRQARPDFFQAFEGPARTRAQIGSGCPGGLDLLVAEGEADIVGLAVLLTRLPSAFAGAVPRQVIELDNLVVRADQRGRVGHRLLAATIEWSRRHGATHVEVAVHAFNHDARRFYENFGFSASIDRLVLAAPGYCQDDQLSRSVAFASVARSARRSQSAQA